MATSLVTRGDFILTVLYITQNGVTDHIGRSQVAPYLLGLAKLGFPIHVLSAEKPGHEDLIQEYRGAFDEAGIRWTCVTYRNAPPLLGQLWTQLLMKRSAARIVRDEGIRVVHCRSFPPALIAHRLKPRLGVKYIFDFRDFYADGGLAKSKGLARLAYSRLKQLEGPMIRHADKVVCLTERARDLLVDWYLRDVKDAKARFQVIPCCADFEHFDPDKVSSEALNNARRKAGLMPDAFVLLYLGSLGPDYLLPQMIVLFRQVLLIRPDACFLFVSNNGEELIDKEVARQGVSAERIRFVSADRSEIPAFIMLADLSVVFIRADVSKAGCSPTKLGELFACNVPVVANAGVGDMEAIISLHRNGSAIVENFSPETLLAAVKKVLQSKCHGNYIRDHSRDLTLTEGVNRYAQVYNQLLKSDIE